MSDDHECSVCSESFDSERGLKIHQGQMHSDEEIEESEENSELNDEESSEEEVSEASQEENADNSSKEDEEKDIEEANPGDKIEVPLKSAMILFLLIGLFSGFSIGFLGASIEGPSIGIPEFNLSNGGEDLEFETVDIGNISLEDEPSLGEDEAPIKIIQYTDFGCPYCSEWHGHDASPVLDADKEEIFQSLKNELIDAGEVELIVKDHPVPDLHPNSVRGHAAANCIYNQDEDEYWSFIDELYSTRDVWTAGGDNVTTTHFESMARNRSNIDTESFIQCYLSTDGSEMVADRSNALRNIGELGTPTFIIGNREDGFVLSEGITRLDEFEKAISQVRN